MARKSTKSKPKRSANFVPQLLLALHDNPVFICKLSDLPASYKSQPYNLAAKVLKRGGMKVNVIVNRERDIFVMKREIVISQN